MKHEIEIPDLPEGWEAVAYRVPQIGEYAFFNGGVAEWGRGNTNSDKLIVRKKQPRRIILEETEEGTDNSHNHTIYVKGITIDIYSNKLWKIVEDNKCAE